MTNKILYFFIAFMLYFSSFAQDDDCVNAITINPNFTSCSFQAGSSANATESLPTCSGGGNADDDVWYKFVANSTNMTITVDPTTGYDAVIQLFSGTCGALTSIQCEDVNGPNGDEVLNNQTLTIGNTYYIRVYHYGSGWGTATFNICVTGLAPPSNDTPCSAYALPVVTPSCNFEIYTNLGAGNSSVPTPSGCGGSSPFDGGYMGGDVWFSVVVPASGQLDIHTLSVDFADGAMALYSGGCSGLSLVQCDDDGEPGDGILMPHIYATGLTPGATMFIRVWEYDNDANGQFGICVSTPDNDDCANAQQICDLNGYGGITSSAYTIDFPDNMTGTGQNGIANSNPTAPFGQTYTGTSPVQIDNNSWLAFTADATTAELFVQVNYCSNGNGMQMQIFSGNNCTNFTAVSTFLETTNSQTITATGLIPGNTYYIMVDGFAGDICSYTISATSGVQVVEITTAKTNICIGDTAMLDAQVTGTGSYTYSWSSTPSGFTSSSPSVSVSPAQNTLYNVDITGVCGSVTSASLYLTVNDYPSVNISVSDTSICLNDVVNLNGNPSGGSMPYSHSWTGTGQSGLNSSAIQTPNFSSAIAGDYSLIYQVTDTVGCSTVDSISVTVNDLPVAVISGLDSICIGDTTTLTATGGVSYLWNNTSTSDSIVVSPSSNTNYAVTVTDNNNCQNSANIDVVVNPLPTPSISGTNVICSGNSTTLTATGGDSFLWNNGATSASITVSPSSDSTYIVIASNSSGCSDTSSILVQVVSNPSGLITSSDGSNFLCEGNATTLTASGGGTYSWNTGQSGDSIVVSPIIDSTYSVIVDAGGCLDTAYFSITVNSLPSISFSGDSVICNGETTTLFASGGTSYIWNNGSTNDSIAVSPSIDSSYSVIVIDTNNCSNSGSINVTVNNLPTPSISGTNIICSGNSTTLTASGGGSYLWNNGATTPSITVSPASDSIYIVTVTNTNGCSDTSSSAVQVLSQPVASINGLTEVCSGNYTTLFASGGGSYTWNDGSSLDSLVANPSTDSTYSVIVNVNGCLDTAFHSIIVNPLPVVNITGTDTICNGQTATLIASGGGTYLWSTFSNSNTINVSPTTTTNYSVTVTDINNCVNNANKNVIVNQLPIINISGTDSICEGNSTTLTASGATSYEWNTLETNSSITVSPASNTTYSVQGTDVNGCSNTAQVIVSILPKPIASIIGDNNMCEGSSLILQGNGGSSYLWNTNETSQSITISPNDTTTYELIAFINSCSDTAYHTVNLISNPSVSNSYSDTIINLGQSVPLLAQGEAPFLWSPSESLSCNNCPNPIATPSETTNYCVEVTKNNCTSSSCVFVEVNNICGEIFVPDAFSPNNDGNNDCLKVYNNCLEEVLFRVYSRWGELLYETTDVEGCWDGSHQGKDLNTGVYAYTVKAILNNGDEINVKGNVTLFR